MKMRIRGPRAWLPRIVVCGLVAAAAAISRPAFAQAPSTAASAAPVAPAAPVAATPEQAAPFVGDWVTTLDAPPGPMAFTIGVKIDAGKVVASVGNDMMGVSPVTDVSLSGKSLVLRYSVDMMGNTAPVAVFLTPDGAKLKTDFSFMDGQFELSGVASKAEAK